MTDVRRLRTWGSVVVGAVLCTLTGCTTEERDGDTLVYKYELWVPAVIFAAGIIAVPIGWMLREKSARFGWGLLIAGPVAALIFAPGLLVDKVTVNDNEFTLRTGFWFIPTRHDVKFDNVATIELIAEERSGRRGKTVSHFLVCHPRSGGVDQKVPIGDLMKDKAIVTILVTAKTRNIPIIDNTRGK